MTQNHEGAVAWCMTPEWELYTTVVTTMGTEDKYYEKGEDRVRRITGWSDKVFDVLAALENGKNAIDMIRRIVV